MRDDGDESAGMVNLKDGSLPTVMKTAGVTVEAQWVKLRVHNESVWLSPTQARFFARKLNYMARLAEQRRAKGEAA